MKKILRRGIMLIAALLTAGLASAQMPGEVPTMPTDSAVRVGKLPNGLTYYIRHNETPKGQADFYIAQKVGSALEEDSQRGLAHFLEHMCFNGTANFPGNMLRDWLEGIGVKFGANLNAYTSVDETVYNISNVPVSRKTVQDSCLLILHDWACDLTLAPEEIDKERGVIHEEWRRRMVGQMRILENILPTIYDGDKYGYRLPIGTMEVVDNFPHQVLVDYYKTWYRPDQQGIVVVGDIDVDYIEGKIKEMFGPIQMPANAKERVYAPVHDTKGTIYAIGSDKEQSNAMVQIAFKQDPMPRELRNTPMYYPFEYMSSLVSSMLNSRLEELSQKPDAAFAYAGSGYGNFWISQSKDAFSLTIIGKGNDILPAVKQVYRELLRAQRGGFTVSEYQRASAEYVSQWEKRYQSRNNTENEDYVYTYVRNFIDGTPMAGIEVEYETYKQLAQFITVDQINQFLPEIITADNRVFSAMLPENDTFVVPTSEQTAAALAEVDAETIEPYKDEMKAEPLIPNLPAPGKIVSEGKSQLWDATEFTLSNGIKVLVKPTKFKDDQILFTANAKGGTSVVGNDKAASLVFFDYSTSTHGLGDYTAIDLQKYLQGKQVHVSLDFSPYTRTVEGETTVKDLPTMMELMYMTFIDFNITPDEFAATQNQIKGVLANQQSKPEYIFSKGMTNLLYASPAEQMISTEIIDAADRQATLDIIHSMLADAGDFTFTFIGDIDIEALKGLLEQYVATLPTDKSKSVAYKFDAGVEPVAASFDKEETTAMQTPQVWSFTGYGANIEYTPKNYFALSIGTQVLSKRLLEKIREDMGATYSVGSYSRMYRTFNGVNTLVQIPFPMKPELKSEVHAEVDRLFDSVTTEMSDADINAIKEYLVKNMKEGYEKNESWLGAINGYMNNGVDTFNGAVDVINSITTEDVKAIMKQLKDKGYKYRYILNPAE